MAVATPSRVRPERYNIVRAFMAASETYRFLHCKHFVSLPNEPARNNLLRSLSQNLRRETIKMSWQERAASALKDKRVSTGDLAVALGVTPQSAGQKLRGDRGVSVDELKVIAGLAGLSVSQLIGDDVVVIELQDEKDLIELFRLLSPEQKRTFLQVGQQFLAANKGHEANGG
jgi:transcriptional regulator with XRE-family HTH domain